MELALQPQNVFGNSSPIIRSFRSTAEMCAIAIPSEVSVEIILFSTPAADEAAGTLKSGRVFRRKTKHVGETIENLVDPAAGDAVRRGIIRIRQSRRAAVSERISGSGRELRQEIGDVGRYDRIHAGGDLRE